MLESTSNSEAGGRLRAERLRVCLSTREVEGLSRQIAEEKNSQDYYISHAWLTDVEKGKFTPTIYKLYSLSLIYKRNYDEILAFFGIHIRDIGQEQMSLPLPRTHLIGRPSPEIPLVSLSDEIRTKLRSEKTNLVSLMFRRWGGIPADLLKHMKGSDCLYGYVGATDFTLYPLIRPGSFVEIDTKQRKIGGETWLSIFERPIYFIELREAYACSWCEIRDQHLLLVPFPHPQNQVRQMRFPIEADILGRVTAVSMRIAEVP
jgi:hypothetical protein